MNVWVLTFKTTGGNGNVSYQSVHTTRGGATIRLLEHLSEIGADLSQPRAEMIAQAHGDDGSYDMDWVIDGKTISYGVHTMPVEGGPVSSAVATSFVSCQ